MSTPPSEPDPYAGPGGSDQDVQRDWVVRPAVPGWSAGPNTYAGPSFDDTGWHIDLSGVDWDQPPEPDYGPDSSRPRDSGRAHRTTLRFRPHGPGTGNGSGGAPTGYREPPTRRGPAPRDGYGGPPPRDGYRTPPPQDFAGPPPGRTGYESPPDAPTVRRSRPGSGRHARPVQPGEQPPSAPGVQPATGLRRPPPAVTGRPGGARLRPGAAPPRPGQLPPLPPPTGRPGTAAPGPVPPAWEQPGLRRPPPAGSGSIPPGAGRRGPAGPGTLPPAAPGVAVPGAGRAAPEAVSVVRSSGVMAAGTLGSRLTGFLRTIAQSYALGAVGIGAAYNLSNTLPNAVYYLALGGIMTSVIVPLLVSAAKRDRGRTRGGYDQRMFTLVTLALAGITLVAELLAVPLVHLYAGSTVSHAPATLHLTVIFALFFIPQIFFYGISSLIGAILNSRGSFAAPMWTPIVNNVVVIGVLGMYVAIAGSGHLAFLDKHPGHLSSGDVLLLGLGTTIGIVAQTIALMPALRRVGFRWQPRTDFRRHEVREIGRMAGWLFGYVATTFVANLVTTRVATTATKAGYTQYTYAWLLFQLPYAVVGISVITALLPRMSAHAAQRRYGLVRQDFSAGVRLSAAIVVPCSLVLAALGAPLAQLFLGHGAMTVADARYTGVVFAVFCLGLVPYMVFQLQLRVFYALHDSRTPAFIGLVTMVVNIVANVVALDALARESVVAALGVGFGLANLVGMVLAWRILSRRLRGLEGYSISRSLVRMHAAALPAALLAVVTGILTDNSFVVVVIGGGLAGLMYLLFAKALRVDELTGLLQAVQARLSR